MKYSGLSPKIKHKLQFHIHMYIIKHMAYRSFLYLNIIWQYSGLPITNILTLPKMLCEFYFSYRIKHIF